MKSTKASWIKIGPICVCVCVLTGFAYGFLSVKPVSLTMLTLYTLALVSVPCLFHLLCAFVLLRPVRMELIAFTMLLVIGTICLSMHAIKFLHLEYADFDKGIIKIELR